MANVYIGSTKWTAVTAWAALTAYNVGDLRRQLAAPAAGSERVFRCTTAGTSLASEPAWTLTAGATTTEVAGPVWTEVTGLSTYNAAGAWGAPHARLRNALAAGWSVAGDQYRVNASHAATEAATVTLTFPGIAASPNTCIVVNDADTALATTATESATGANSIAFAGFVYIYGVQFQAASGASAGNIGFTSASDWGFWFDSCVLKLNTTSVASATRIICGTSASSGQRVSLTNTVCNFGASGQGFSISNMIQFSWTNTASAIAGAAPTTLFLVPPTNPRAVEVTCRGLDLSALGSGNLINAAMTVASKFLFENCKLGSSFNLSTGSIIGQGNVIATFVNCDSGNTNYKYRKLDYQGTVDHETTIVRSGGASDGTTPMARKMVSGANTQFFSPLASDPIYIWNESTGSITVEVEVVTDGVTLKDNEAWLSVTYLGTSGFPQSVALSDRAADILATGANQTSSSVTWTTTGLGSPVKQKLSVTFTPASKGPLRVSVVLAKQSTTMYFCPKVTVS